MLAGEGVMATGVPVGAPARASWGAVSSGAQVTFLRAGVVQRAPVWSVGSVAFEETAPVRSLPSYRGGRGFPGLWWSATSGRLVGYESWLGRDQAMVLDFDPRVVGFAAQPFGLSWPGVGRWHVPDFFARLEDGTGVVLDAREPGPGRVEELEVFSAVERAGEQVG